MISSIKTKRQPLFSLYDSVLWRERGGWQIRTHWTSHGKHNHLISTSYSPWHQMLKAPREDKRWQYTCFPLSSVIKGTPWQTKWSSLQRPQETEECESGFMGAIRGRVCSVQIPSHTHWFVCRSSMPSRTPFSCSLAAVYFTGFTLLAPLGSPFPSSLIDLREFLPK